jgi:hypothetical protein
MYSMKCRLAQTKIFPSEGAAAIAPWIHHWPVCDSLIVHMIFNFVTWNQIFVRCKIVQDQKVRSRPQGKRIWSLGVRKNYAYSASTQNYIWTSFQLLCKLDFPKFSRSNVHFPWQSYIRLRPVKHTTCAESVIDMSLNIPFDATLVPPARSTATHRNYFMTVNINTTTRPVKASAVSIFSLAASQACCPLSY